MSTLRSRSHDAGTFAAVAIGDIHGSLGELTSTLKTLNFLHSDSTWAGGDRHLYFLGDYMDRGPDGAGVVHLIRRLQRQSATDGGRVTALLGNHEVLALGRHLFGNRTIQTPLGERSFEASWNRNGGLVSDQEALSEDDYAWLAALPAMAINPAPEPGGLSHLLIHSDTTEYGHWGENVETVNSGIREALESGIDERIWDVWARLTTRAGFRESPLVAAGFLARFGADRLVHGHSIIGEVHGYSPALTEGPDVYAQGRVVDIDGGLYEGGPCLALALS